MTKAKRAWPVFTRNREAVVEALEEGPCDGILPAARGSVDGFAEFLLRTGTLDDFKAFWGRRARRSIPILFSATRCCIALGSD